MTGAEMVPVAKVAASIAKKAVSDKDDKQKLQELAIKSPNMEAAAESYARRVAVKEAVLLKVYQPLARFLGVTRNYFDTEFHSDMAQKVADIPEEYLTTPSPSVAIPAMQGLGYSVDEPELKEMYLNLLATATDDRVKEAAHPSFAEIIKQLSPGEANLLLESLRQGSMAVGRLMRKAESGEGGTLATEHIIQLVESETGLPAEELSIAVWIDNWIRLGLVEVDYSRAFVALARYDYIEKRPEFARLAESDARGKESLTVEKGILRSTNFGSRFLEAVSFDGVPVPGLPVME